VGGKRQAQHRAEQKLGFRPGDEDPRGHRKLPAKKGAKAHDEVKRLALSPPRHHFPKADDERFGDLLLGVGQHEGLVLA
jgi:hypothetical protein